jgi:hypothetical protein
VFETLWEHINQKIEKKTEIEKDTGKKENDPIGPAHLGRPKQPDGRLPPRASSPTGRLRHGSQFSFLSFPNL